MKSALPTIPEGLDLIPTGDGYVIRRVWLTWKIIPLGLFAVVWNCFLFFWYTQLLSRPNPPLMMILFPLVHVAVGIAVIYYAIVTLLNKTEVTVSSSRVRVATGPAPWPGNKELEASMITDISVRKREKTRGQATYNVMYADMGRKERKLVAGLPEPDQAEFVAQVVRATLGLDQRRE